MTMSPDTDPIPATTRPERLPGADEVPWYFNREASWLEFWAEGHIYSPTGARARIGHNGGLNAAFCDGHAKWVKYSNLKPELLTMQEGTYTPYPYPIPPVDDN